MSSGSMINRKNFSSPKLLHSVHLARDSSKVKRTQPPKPKLLHCQRAREVGVAAPPHPPATPRNLDFPPRLRGEEARSRGSAHPLIVTPHSVAVVWRCVRVPSLSKRRETREAENGGQIRCR
ncbi:hypothetical protein CEXT_195181 [Caerostris extrusa]|uniref:Uncharacterized protein n=1 Tax=Caerostris extrusa TaxID=172846 RepID=A0AAV4M7I3_CAEEX|nr:hypothetical protein CEXT_195181 [Caerostris extrusa]